ncbi:Signal recognition particle subunit SRP72 [Gnomoniopsis smithogilvyi]|uniref:Signal recognition particle subunit SRP72 n=1 Tax=Gnomoniopsis smithogilvyi TaxID=1191159 RepID=A0A9W8YNH3_9PEZI|nr:Signal recognition particle subunit SRP72 [Gnomoniopsis smithogilvyi]
MASALTSLLARTSIEDHDEALSTADAALKATPNHLPAQQTKVIALLRLERYDDALRVIASGGDQLEARCVLGKSYALYKTGALDEAFAHLKKYEGALGSDRALRHVAAQVAYRIERFDEAVEMLNGLLEDQQGGNVGEDTDLKINLLAAYAQLEWQGRGDLVPEKGKKPGREDMEAFETAYNAGCGSLARGDLAKASVLLKRAADLCDAAEDLSEEDKKMEMLPIILQQAYVLALMGKKEEAASLQKGVEGYEISDESIDAAGKWNSLISKSLTNPFMIQRLSELVPEASTGNSKLFKHQEVSVLRNKAAIDLQCYKRRAVKNHTAHLIKENPKPSTDLDKVTWGYLNATAKARSETDSQALAKILETLEKRPYDVGLLLTVIHFYVQVKKYDSAIDVLHKFFRYIEELGASDHEDVRYAPGLVALAVALYRTQNRKRDIRAELGRAAAYWQSIPKNSSTTLLREAGVELLYSSKPSDLSTAGAAFERLVSQDPDDKIAHAGLIASFATTDYAKVEPHLSSLDSIEKLTAGIDVSTLLDAGVPAFPAPATPSPARKKRKVDDSETAAADGATTKPTTTQPSNSEKKKKKPRLGKNYDPNVKPDPERWLPVRDRSNYRPKGKKGKKKVAESTQGGFSNNDNETLNLAGGAGQIKVEKAPQSGGGGKKKKGRK